MIAHICQCHIIALQKGKAGVVILKIKGFPHPLWHLINKAEHAVIAAGPILIHQALFKFNPQILVILFFNLKLPLFSVRLFNQQDYFFIMDEEMIVKYILHYVSIDLQELVSRLHAQFFGNTSRRYRPYFMFMLF